MKESKKAATGKSYLDFSRDDVLLRAIMYDIMVIGGASKDPPEDLKTYYAYIPWKNVFGARDKIVRDYFDVDVDIIWNIIPNELPKLKSVVNDYIAKNPELKEVAGE